MLLSVADTTPPTRYCGRFAPSPTGPLHFGSLVAATASFLQARQQQGRWLLRIEDIDPPRELPGASAAICRTLEAYGFVWDGTVHYQSQRKQAYQAALDALIEQGQIYACGCTRSEIADSTFESPHGPVYPGTCRNGLPTGRAARTLRVRSQGVVIEFADALQGAQRHELESECGDFVVRRADGLFAYQLAVVVDDASQGVTEVVRGCDLLDSTPRQIHLQRLLGLPTPAYLHLPAAVNTRGEKLSKQTGATPIDLKRPAQTLCDALHFLGQHPPRDLYDTDIESVWNWAIQNWNSLLLPKARHLTLDDQGGKFGYHGDNTS